MSEQSRRRTWDVKRTWVAAAQPIPKTNICSVCGKPGASYSINNGWSWFCWPCKPDNATWDVRYD